MKKSKKFIIFSFIPVAIILVFVLYMLLPAYGVMNKKQEELKTKQFQLENAKNKLEQAKEAQKLADEIKKMASKLGIFDVSVPEKKELEILLIDLEKFARHTGIKILNMNANPEKKIEIKDPEKDENSDSKKALHKTSNKVNKSKKARKSKRKRGRSQEEPQPISVFEVPLEITVLGSYPKIIQFIDKLENYQRMVVIDGIWAKDYSKDIDAEYPRVELKINSRIFNLVENKIKKENEDES